MGLTSQFNAATEHKERIFSELNGRTTSIGYLRHLAQGLVFEPQDGADMGICAHYAARTAAKHPDEQLQVQWQGRTYTVGKGMQADDIATLITGNPAPVFDGIFTTKMRMPPEAVKGAIEGDDFGALRTCLQNNAFPDAIYEDGSTALTMAAVMDNGLSYVKLLLQYGADVNLATKIGMTPLMMAAIKGDIEVARFLLDAGADNTRVNKDGWDAARIGTNEKIREFLSGPYPAEAAERIRQKKAEEEAAMTAAATVLQHTVKTMFPLKLKKKPGNDA